ncbi:MAG: hypothetical protein A2202_06665 [Bdellovibrionales bacterium RIFOXYA1_FULL_36_14]|nr:MAG: hypothetical protein A2202_06665 [Bdellovibrionales bacterium RIFOXYA1_FULL_36_14]
MKLRILLFILFITLIALHAVALEIDEKLTCRVLRLSSTKKTMLINRGMEDGLVVGDHAKFFITTGVVARAVVLKASPSRTIWAIYRMINPKEINVDSVVNLKISAPVKLTNDSSLAFGADQYDDGNSENPNLEDMGNNVDLGGRSEDVPVDLRRTNPRAGARGNVENDDSDLEDMYATNKKPIKSTRGRNIFSDESGVDTSRDWEAWSLYSLGILSTSSEEGDESKSTNYDLYLGIEKYFNNPSAWFNKISPVVFIHTSSNSELKNEVTDSNSTFQLGMGANYNFSASPFAYNRIMGFIGTSLAYGSANSQNGTEEASGKASTITVGGGIKYYLPMGLGFRFMLNYQSESQSFTFDDNTSLNTTTTGFVTYAGLSYRF